MKKNKLITIIGIQFIILVIIFLSYGCDKKIDMENEIKELKQADITFSNLSKEKGASEAFLEYVDKNGVLLRPNSNPIVGKEAVLEHLKKSDDSKFTLTWEPMYAEISKSADLGYTYGKYTFTTEEKTSFGTYVSIWKKDENNDWKFVLDTGNDGLGK